jgi:hypothetical protein
MNLAELANILDNLNARGVDLATIHLLVGGAPCVVADLSDDALNVDNELYPHHYDDQDTLIPSLVYVEGK